MAASRLRVPNSMTWSQERSQRRDQSARPRDFHSATLLLDGTVLITGGQLTAASAEVFDPSTGRFASTAEMSATRAGHSATALNDGTVLVAGGFSFEAVGAYWCCFASAELYVGATIPGGQLPSADTTTVPPATQIVDTSGAIWTIGWNLAILRNGVHAAGGWGSQIFWRNHTLYVLGTDDNRDQWTDPAGRFWDQLPRRVARRHHGSPCDADC